jgi:hypothetical protein
MKGLACIGGICLMASGLTALMNRIVVLSFARIENELGVT